MMDSDEIAPGVFYFVTPDRLKQLWESVPVVTDARTEIDFYGRPVGVGYSVITWDVSG